jgi:hypothetical protein
VRQVLRLGVAARRPADDDERDVAICERIDHPPDDGNRRIAGIADAEDDLVRGVVLVAERAEVILEAVVEPADRLEDRHGGREVPRRTGRPSAEGDDTPGRGREIGDPGHGRGQEETDADGRQDHKHLV